MSTTAFVQSLAEALEAEGTEERATHEKRYLKSELRHFGVKVPIVRKVAKGFFRAHRDLDRQALWSLVDALWAEGIYELRSVAVFLLECYRASLRAGDMPRFATLLGDSHTWALVDTLAIAVVGDVVARFSGTKKTLRRWAKHDDFWLRRSALLALLGERRAGGTFDIALFTSLSEPMLEEKEFFIRKAIGWVLRDVSRRDPDITFAYLKTHQERLSGLSLREGAKHLSDERRAALGLR